MLHPNPDHRPKDLVVLGEMIRGCLLKIERRLALADRYGIPIRTTIPQPTRPRPRRLLRTALAFGALVVGAAVAAAVLFPESIGTVLHKARETKPVGVLVGVPESSPTPASAGNASGPVAPATVLSQAANSALALANQPAANGTEVPNSQAQSPNSQQFQVSNEQSQASATPQAIAKSSPGSAPAGPAETEAAASASPKASEVGQPSVVSQSSSGSTKKRAPSTSLLHQGSMRVRMVGITSDGRLIYRLPSGRTRIVAPDSDENQSIPHRHRRAIIQRDQMFAPPPQFGPDYFPDD